MFDLFRQRANRYEFPIKSISPRVYRCSTGCYLPARGRVIYGVENDYRNFIFLETGIRGIITAYELSPRANIAQSPLSLFARMEQFRVHGEQFLHSEWRVDGYNLGERSTRRRRKFVNFPAGY